MLLALRYYGRQMVRLRRFTVPAMALPALGNTCIFYIAPLIVAQLVGRFTGRGPTGIGVAMPYVLGFAGVLLFAEILWRIGIHCLNRLDGRGIENLYGIHRYGPGAGEAGGTEVCFRCAPRPGAGARADHDQPRQLRRVANQAVLSFASRFEDFADNMVFNIVGSLVPLAFASVVLWHYDPLLVVGLIGLIAATGGVIAPLIRRRQKLVDQREEAIAQVSGHVADTLMNMDTIRAFAAEDREAAEHRSRVADQRRKSLRSWDYGNLRIDALVAPMSVLTNALGLVLAVALGRGKHGIEAIIVAFTYYSNATRIMFEFNQIYRRLESSLTEAAQFTELLLTRPTVLDPIAPEPLRPRASDVRFERVTFAHAGGLPLFTGLDLTVPSGTKLGLVGRSGGGKTTLTRLLLRMTDVADGRILIGGQDISKLRQSDLRSLIAYVPQVPALFHRSLRDNIAFARPHATEAEIHQAAHVTEFAGSLPDGFDTMVGERGVKLSGGQRQRVALAQAILRDAPILLLDEATSALDSESEILIQRALWRLMQDRTALVVARMDQLVVLDRGQIAEKGTHQELLRRNGIYARLWQHQSGGFLDDDDATTAMLAEAPRLSA